MYPITSYWYKLKVSHRHHILNFFHLRRVFHERFVRNFMIYMRTRFHKTLLVTAIKLKSIHLVISRSTHYLKVTIFHTLFHYTNVSSGSGSHVTSQHVCLVIADFKVLKITGLWWPRRQNFRNTFHENQPYQQLKWETWILILGRNVY
jgi:hypothetical protein